MSGVECTGEHLDLLQESWRFVYSSTMLGGLGILRSCQEVKRTSTISGVAGVWVYLKNAILLLTCFVVEFIGVDLYLLSYWWFGFASTMNNEQPSTMLVVSMCYDNAGDWICWTGFGPTSAMPGVWACLNNICNLGLLRSYRELDSSECIRIYFS